jgi:hypothetical protein
MAALVNMERRLFFLLNSIVCLHFDLGKKRHCHLIASNSKSLLPTNCNSHVLQKPFLFLYYFEKMIAADNGLGGTWTHLTRFNTRLLFFKTALLALLFGGGSFLLGLLTTALLPDSLQASVAGSFSQRDVGTCAFFLFCGGTDFDGGFGVHHGHEFALELSGGSDISSLL